MVVRAMLTIFTEHYPLPNSTKSGRDGSTAIEVDTFTKRLFTSLAPRFPTLHFA